MSAIPRVIIADDEASFRSMTASVLGAQNYDFVMAGSGEEALSAARAQPPDLILLDVRMPGMDGLQTCREVRADDKLAEVPVVLFTGLTDREARLRGFEAGADDFLSKPYDPDELRLRVRGITRLNRFRRIHDNRRRTERVIAIAREGYLLVRQDGVLLQANPAAWRLLGGIPEQGGRELHFIDLLRRHYRCESAESLIRDVWSMSAEPSLLVGKDPVTHQARWLQLEVLDAHAATERWLRLQDVSNEHALQRDLWTFHGAVSHKLRTPLNGLLGSLELLLLDLEDAGPDVQELVTMARDSATRLDKNISDILIYVGAGQRNQPKSPATWTVTHLPELVAAASDRMGVEKIETILGPGAAAAQIALPVETLALCLEALLDNARKFHPQKKPAVKITATVESERLHLIVQDDGEPLPPKNLGKVWEPYYQAEASYSGEVPGMGLGLSMVSAIVLDAGGERTLRNRTDAPGVEVEIIVPCTMPAPKSAPLAAFEGILGN